MIRLRLVTFAFAFFLTQVLFASTANVRVEERDRVAHVNILPTSLNFGTVQSGSYVTKSDHIENTGHVTILVYATSVDGAAFDINCPKLPLALKPRSTLSCNVGFHPQSAAKYTGRIIVWFKWRDRDDWDEESKHDGGRVEAPLRPRWWHRAARAIDIVGFANDSAGIISPFPSSINFDRVQVSERKSVTETLANSGQAALTISNIVALGAGFSFSGINPPLTLSPGQSVSFVVSYVPTSGGVSWGSLAIESNASNPRLSLTLVGRASVPGQLRVSSRAINFGNVVTGSTQKGVETLLADRGPVTISSASSNNAEFATRGISVPMTIPSGAQAPTLSGSEVTGQPLLSALLMWSAVPGASYNVYRSTYQRWRCEPTMAWTEIAENLAGTTYTDTPAKQLGPWCYAVTTMVGSTESGLSNLVNIEFGNHWYWYLYFKTPDCQTRVATPAGAKLVITQTMNGVTINLPVEQLSAHTFYGTARIFDPPAIYNAVLTLPDGFLVNYTNIFADGPPISAAKSTFWHSVLIQGTHNWCANWQFNFYQ